MCLVYGCFITLDMAICMQGGRRLVNVCVRVYVEKYSTDFVNFFNLSILHVEVDNNPAMAVKETEGRGREWYRHEEENYQMEKGRDI